MKRRDFLKGIVGVGALVVVPALAKESEAERQVKDSVLLRSSPSGLVPIKQEGGLINFDKHYSGESLFKGDFVSIDKDTGLLRNTPLSEKTIGVLMETVKANEIALVHPMGIFDVS